MLTRKVILFVLQLTISVSLLVYVFYRMDVKDVAERLQTVRLVWLIPAVALGPVCIFVAAWRWKILSLGLLDYWQTVRYTWIGVFFGSILPSVVGGDVAKGASLATKQSNMRDMRLPLSILADKIVGFWTLLLMFDLVASLLLVTQPALSADLRRALLVTSVATAAGLLAGLIVTSRHSTAILNNLSVRLPVHKLRQIIQKILAASVGLHGRTQSLIRAALLSGLLHAFTALLFWFAMRALAIPATLWFAAVFYALLSVLLALPVSISGIGVRDVFAASIFNSFGLDPASGVAFSWLLLALSTPNIAIGAGIQVLEIFWRRREELSQT